MSIMTASAALGVLPSTGIDYPLKLGDPSPIRQSLPCWRPIAGRLSSRKDRRPIA
jgi:hypothetical protein